MRHALSVWFLVITLLGCLATPDGILDRLDNPSDFDGSGDPRAGPVAAVQHPSTPLPRPGDYNRPLWLHSPPRPSTQWPDPRVLLVRLGSGGSSRWMPGRTLYPRRNVYAARTPLSLSDPARAV